MLSPNEWQYSCNGMVEMVCPKCYTAIKQVPMDDFHKKDLLMGIIKDFNERK